MTTKSTRVDKARQQAAAKVDAVMKDVEQRFLAFGPERDRSESGSDVKAFRAKVEAASREASPAATKTLLGLLKTGEALIKTLDKRAGELFWAHRRVSLRADINAALAAALLDIGKL